MLHFEICAPSAAWVSLLTLAFLEIILGIDNIIFISIITGKLPKEEQRKGRLIGLALALVMRIILLLGIAYIASLTKPIFTIAGAGFSGRDLILFGGGLFLIYKSTVEIHEKIEPNEEEGKNFKARSLKAAIVQIILIDLVFSFDSILTAVGLVKEVIIMILAVVISMFIMMAFSKNIADFINERPTLKVLALSFLIMIGFMLVFEGLHSLHHQEIPKGYAYFAMAFAFGVEILNLRVRPKQLPKG
jgi:predicted tellurium resistance membrane protein TerC